MGTPFQIFPWQKPFLSALKSYVDDVTEGKTGRALIITPNLRPARYLANLYRKDRKARLLPKMLSVNDLVTNWRASLAERPLHIANTLDQIAIVHECVRELDLSGSISAIKDNDSDIGAFMPWGLKLAKLLEDFAIEGREIRDFPSMEDELGKTPAAILSSLREINDLWEDKLKARNWTTIGQDHKFVAAHADQIPGFLLPLPERPVFIAGFYILSGSHEALFKSLWKAGAHVCLHTDPAIVGGSPHLASSEHGKWIKRWHADTRIPARTEESIKKPKMSWFAGHDLHSQLQEMRKILQPSGQQNNMTTAVIPCREDALTPILQHLPPKNVNISMGYPMERTPLIRLIKSILSMFVHSPDAGRWKSAEVLEVLRHPYVRILLRSDELINQSGRLSDRELEQKVSRSGLFWKMPEEESGATSFIGRLNACFADIDTMEKLGVALDAFCQWLLERGKEELEQAYPLDLEVMHRIIHHVVPVLRGNLLSSTSLAMESLSDIFLDLVKNENIPFQADPIEGLQVMGLLESRLLQFDRVILLDATDDRLPKKAVQDPLFPEALRALAGLPDNRTREATTAHNLYRLMAGASEVHFLWQEGTPAGDFYDSKKSRSRFVERLLWEEEQKKPELLESRQGLVRHALTRLHMPERKMAIIRNSPEFQIALDRFWSKPVSVTLLDTYLACPVKFIFDNIMGLNSPEGRSSRDAQVGTFVHKILQIMYDPAESATHPGDLAPEEYDTIIENCFRKAEERLELKQQLNPDDYEAVNISVPRVLREYLRHPTHGILASFTEKKLTGSVQINDRKLKLKGRIDRLDLRSDGLYIIDYKTSSKLPKNNKGFWEDGDFFQGISDACATRDAKRIVEYFAILSKSVGSLQLPLYLFLLGETSRMEYDSFPANASWIGLRLKHMEENLLESSLTGTEDPRLGHFRQTLNLIYNHMRLCPEFTSAKVSACEKCGISALCGA